MSPSPAALDAIFAACPVAVLSTFGPGRIDSVPIVFVACDGNLFSPIDAKPKAGTTLAREKNLLVDARYTLLLQHYEPDWHNLWWLRLRGRARVQSLAPDAGRVISLLRAKYPQYERVDLHTGEPRLLRFQIDSVNAWAYQGLDWLERRFGSLAGP